MYSCIMKFLHVIITNMHIIRVTYILPYSTRYIILATLIREIFWTFFRYDVIVGYINL